MDIQLVIVSLIVLAAVGYMVWRAKKARKGQCLADVVVAERAASRRRFNRPKEYIIGGIRSDKNAMNAYRFVEGYPISQCVALCRRDFGENAKTPVTTICCRAFLLCKAASPPSFLMISSLESRHRKGNPCQKNCEQTSISTHWGKGRIGAHKQVWGRRTFLQKNSPSPSHAFKASPL